MSLRTFGIGAAVAGAAAFVVTAEPVQAVSIAGETLNFGGSAELVDNGSGNFTVEFGSGNTIDIDSAFGSAGTPFNVANLNLSQTSPSSWELASGPVVWLSGLPNGIQYIIDTFDLQDAGAPLGFAASVSGLFQPANLDGTGSFTSQGTFDLQPTSYSSTIVAGEEIPTPALLPGLVGMGVAALRKRGSSEEETAEA